MKDIFRDFEDQNERSNPPQCCTKSVVNFGMPGYEDAQGYFINPNPKVTGIFWQIFTAILKLIGAMK